MAFINEKDREINCKIVFFGPPLSGKSTSLRHIHSQMTHDGKGDSSVMIDEEDRTLYFDFAPVSLGKIKNYDVRMHLYTVPGQHAYEQSRRLISKGVDGIVFVADSALEMVEGNILSLKELKKIADANGLEWGSLPKVFQYNKRDLDNAVPILELHNMLNSNGDPEFETTAIKGLGLFDVIAAISEKVLLNLKENA